MDKLQAIEAFTLVVEQGGFTKAARRHRMSASAISKIIVRLEDELGTQLFNRTTRRIALTDSGREFYDRCVHVIAALKEAEAVIRDSEGTAGGRVRMVMPFSFGRVTMIPALAEFLRRYPNIDLEISFSDLPVDLIQEGFDLAIRSGDLTDSRLIRRVLTEGPMIAVASPDYLKRRGTPQTPSDLVDHDCIINSRIGRDWIFQDGDRPITVQVNGRVWLGSGDTVREAAAAGLGIAQWTWWLFRRDLEAGRVVPVLPSYAREGVAMCVLYPGKRHVPKKVSAVIDYLMEITGAEKMK